MAKKTRNEFSNEPIFVTSFMKNISKEAISQRIMALIYHFQCIAIEMNGRDPHMKAYRTTMVDEESGLGIDFDKHTWTYSLRSKKLLSIDSKIEGTRVILDFHIYNQDVEKQTGIAEEFPSDKIKEELESQKVVFKDDDEAFDSLCVGGSNFKSKENKKELKEEPKAKKQEEVEEEEEITEEYKPKTYTEDELFEHMDELFKNGGVQSMRKDFNQFENEQERMYQMMYDIAIFTGEADVCDMANYFYSYDERLEIKQTSLKELTAACIKLIDEYFITIPYYAFIEDDTITGENGHFPRWADYKQRVQQIQ